ncbi:hypothetical protein [Burkholderia sp. IMCC1007]|uniref:hypothetical protein n=1 Tax=Burkholderia sp. IMCC1007 TaxID=3004104 RepID=UPI0022B44FB1|nr:hypothetical protein [Burkholderia sp. IMCC1007]
MIDMTFHRMEHATEAGDRPDAGGHGAALARRARTARVALRAGGAAPSTSLQLDRT